MKNKNLAKIITGQNFSQYENRHRTKNNRKQTKPEAKPEMETL